MFTGSTGFDGNCRELTRRSRNSWDSLPARFRYKPECWNSELQPPVIVALTDVRLKVLYNDFNIHKLIEAHDLTGSARMALVEIAVEIVTILLQLGNAQHRAVFVHHEFRYVVSHVQYYLQTQL
jgi:hypothetical protein